MFINVNKKKVLQGKIRNIIFIKNDKNSTLISTPYS